MAIEILVHAITQWALDEIKDEKRAFAFLEAAAGQGDDYAQYNLGWLYAQGGGANPSMQQAIKWLRKAAEQGSSFAHDELKRLEQNN